MFLTQIRIPSSSPILFPNLGLELNPSNLVFPKIEALSNIHWYGVIIALGLVLAVVYGPWRKKDVGITEDNILTLLLIGVPAAIICARAYYCIFNWELFKNNPISCLYIWEGGLAIYGGIIGGVAAGLIYCRAAKISFGAMADLGGMGFLIGQSIGRWGNFMNREAFGAPTDSFLKMGLYDVFGTLEYYHPTFFYESLWNAVGFALLHFYFKKRKYDGEIFTLYVAWYGLGRFFVEGLRTDSLYIPHTTIRVSQLLGIVSFVLAIGFFLYMRLYRKADGKNLYVHKAESKS